MTQQDPVLSQIDRARAGDADAARWLLRSVADVLDRLAVMHHERAVAEWFREALPRLEDVPRKVLVGESERRRPDQTALQQSMAAALRSCENWHLVRAFAQAVVLDDVDPVTLQKSVGHRWTSIRAGAIQTVCAEANVSEDRVREALRELDGGAYADLFDPGLTRDRLQVLADRFPTDPEE